MQEEKKLIDIEEAKYQAEKRKAAIERAKTLQYYKTDRVKEYHVRNNVKINIKMLLNRTESYNPVHEHLLTGV